MSDTEPNQNPATVELHGNLQEPVDYLLRERRDAGEMLDDAIGAIIGPRILFLEGRDLGGDITIEEVIAFMNGQEKSAFRVGFKENERRGQAVNNS